MTASKTADKASVLGVIVTAASCPACFPALASLGAALGLGFLAEYEGLFITRLLPLFAGVALLANALGWLKHRNWLRSALGMAGPAIVLAVVLFYMGQRWSAPVLYAGLALMVSVSLWDLFGRRFGRRRAACSTDGCPAGTATIKT